MDTVPNIKKSFEILNTNTILYCHQWQACVSFYRDALGLPITHQSNWFIEFRWGDSHLSVADERQASIDSSKGSGITLTMEVGDVQQVHQQLQDQGIQPEPIKTHDWGAQVFYFYDPEGHRLEVWQRQD